MTQWSRNPAYRELEIGLRCPHATKKSVIIMNKGNARGVERGKDEKGEVAIVEFNEDKQ